MTAGTERLHVGPRDHVVQFYGHDRELTDGVGDYLLDAVMDGGAAVVIATPAHRAAFEDRLADAGVDVMAAVERGVYLALDASEIAGRFMIAGRPDGAAFQEVVGRLIRTAIQSGAPVRAYGEMVALLWDSGLAGAAIELETLWDDLARRYPFSLLCAYQAQAVSGSGHFDAFNEVCLLHDGIVGASPGGAQTRVFPLSRGAPAHARHFAVGAVGRLGAEHLAGDVALVVTEFAANATRHARTGFTVVLSRDEDVVRVSVRDRSGLPATGLPAAPPHGLGAVSALAAKWGVVPLGAGGKAVWAELTSLPVRPASHPSGKSRASRRIPLRGIAATPVPGFTLVRRGRGRVKRYRTL